jgi:hypothetical protein
VVSGNYLMPAANTNPVAASAAPATKSAVSNRVSFQSLRMLHLNRWPTSQAESLRLPFWRRSLGDKWAAQSLLRACPRRLGDLSRLKAPFDGRAPGQSWSRHIMLACAAVRN